MYLCPIKCFGYSIYVLYAVINSLRVLFLGMLHLLVNEINQMDMLTGFKLQLITFSSLRQLKHVHS